METLVLDAGYQPIDRVTWEKAFTLFFLGKVEIVEEYEDRHIRSATIRWKMPAVIRFLQFVSNKKMTVKFTRENVYTRDRGKCQYCSKNLKRAEITYDHVIPKVQGGKTNWRNIVICCMPCNQKKKDKTPEQAKMKLLKTPTKPKNMPNSMYFTFVWRKEMPKEWKSYCYDMSYWNADLEEE